MHGPLPPLHPIPIPIPIPMRNIPLISPFLKSLLSPTMHPHHHRRYCTTAAAATHHHHPHNSSNNNEKKKDNIVVIVGATGTGKTRLSIDVASRFRGEVINSDKIQVYRGLDITTNKVAPADRRGVPHHLLGSVDPSSGELSPAAFRRAAAAAVRSVAAGGRLPVVAGGSNSLVHALVSERYDPGAPRAEMFAPAGLRYRCCFVWVDVEEETLGKYLDMRVDEMVGSGMVEELEEYFRKDERERGSHAGLRKAIGVPEFERYFGRRSTFSAAVGAIKENTRRLAAEQVGKIRRLGEEAGWALRRVDATAAVRARIEGGPGKEAWERDVMGPTLEAVERFLEGDEPVAEMDQDRGHDHRSQNYAAYFLSIQGGWNDWGFPRCFRFLPTQHLHFDSII